MTTGKAGVSGRGADAAAKATGSGLPQPAAAAAAAGFQLDVKAAKQAVTQVGRGEVHGMATWMLQGALMVAMDMQA